MRAVDCRRLSLHVRCCARTRGRMAGDVGATANAETAVIVRTGVKTRSATQAPVLLLPVLLALLPAACGRPAAEDGARQPELEGGRLQLSEMPCDVAAPPPDAATVQVVFSCGEEPFGTWRVVPAAASDTLALALRELLQGPTAEERAAGLNSFFSSATSGMLLNARIADGVAYVDFADFSQVVPNASTSAGSAQLMDQLAGTIFQFDGLREAEITFHGDCAAFWNWLQRDCQRLVRDEE
jgi:hypothetical protein